MGGELSAESGKNASRAGISRTSSLKDISMSDENANKIEPTSPGGKPVKRSSTFSGGRTRPQIIRREKKKSKQQAIADEHREACISDDTGVDVADGTGTGIEFKAGKQRTGSTSTEESLFIPTKKTLEKIESPGTSPSETEFPVNKQGSSVFDSQGSVKSSSNSRNSSQSVPESESPSYRRRLSSSSVEEQSLSRGPGTRSKSESEKGEIIPITYRKEKVEDEYKVNKTHINRLKSSEKRKKVGRSKSLGAPPELDALLEERDDEDGKLLRPNEKTHTKSLEGIEEPSSDNQMRREEHVKRAAHFSAMLKQFKENKVRLHQELSSYGREVIAKSSNSSSPLQTPPPVTARKHLRQNDFFDSWVKDQSDRIDKLANALKGDEFTINELRSSFRGRDLKSNIKLPLRSCMSDRLPRRHIQYKKSNKYLSSDTEDELDNNAKCSGSYDYASKSKVDDRDVLNKQLMDTFSLLDSYFESKKDMSQYERSRSADSSGSAHSSSVSLRMSSNFLFPENETKSKNTEDQTLKNESPV